MVPDENSMEDPLCNSSFGSMVSLDYVTPDTNSGATADEVSGTIQHVASGQTPSARPRALQRSGRADVASFQRQLENSEVMVGPDWNHCFEYEFQHRKDALRRAEEEGLPIGAALWATYNCPQHHVEHWITFLTVANAEKDKQVKSIALENKVSSLEKQLASLRNNRSRSPRKQLAFTEKPWSEKSTSHREERAAKGRGRGKGSAKSQTRWNSKGDNPGPAKSEGVEDL